MFTIFGKIAKFVHRPRVKPEVKLVTQGLRRLPFSVREEVSRELKRLQDDGMIEPVAKNVQSHLLRRRCQRLKGSIRQANVNNWRVSLHASIEMCFSSVESSH